MRLIIVGIALMLLSVGGCTVGPMVGLFGKALTGTDLLQEPNWEFPIDADGEYTLIVLTEGVIDDELKLLADVELPEGEYGVVRSDGQTVAMVGPSKVTMSISGAKYRGIGDFKLTKGRYQLTVPEEAFDRVFSAQAEVPHIPFRQCYQTNVGWHEFALHSN